MTKVNGPLSVKLRVKAGAAGEGHIDIMSADKDKPDVAASVPFTISSGDWQELGVEVKHDGPLGTLRVYLPASQPVEIDWIETRPAKAKAMRWEFNAK